MYIETPRHEDLPDFVATLLICADCRYELEVSGPVPADAICSRCGSAALIRLVEIPHPVTHELSHVE